MKATHRAAAYCRLSRDDGDKPESDSIANQKKLIEDFCAQRPELARAVIYTDDGRTGANFDRPAFQRMLADIEAGTIDCVIVKDLSRFGRDYIGVGFYLERYFPEKGVRFIAINDGVDSARGAYDLLLPLKNVFNAQYAKDASDKVRKTFRAKQERGEFIGAFPPYGYRKDPANKNRFVVDPEAAEVVRRVFALAAAGEAHRAIAAALNREGVLSPIAYKRSRGDRLQVNRKGEGPCRWSAAAVKRTLENEVYLGSMVSNRFPSDGMHGKTRRADRSEWIVVQGTHEPIVTRALWDAAQAKTAARRSAAQPKPPVRRKPEAPPHTALFRGRLRCGDCGRALVKRGGNSAVYVCSAYKSGGSAACARHAVSESTLAALVLSDLNALLAKAGDIHRLATRAKPEHKQPETDARRAASLDRIRRQKQLAYEDYRAKRLSRDEYLRRRADCDAREAALAARPAKREAPARDAPGPYAEQLLRRGRLDTLERADVERAVREIRVFENDRLEIVYCFREVEPMPDAKNEAPPAPRTADAYTVERIFAGDRTAEEVVADLIRVHTETGA